MRDAVVRMTDEERARRGHRASVQPSALRDAPPFIVSDGRFVMPRPFSLRKALHFAPELAEDTFTVRAINRMRGAAIEELQRAMCEAEERIARRLIGTPNLIRVLHQHRHRVEYRVVPPGARHVDDVGPVLGAVELVIEATSVRVVAECPLIRDSVLLARSAIIGDARQAIREFRGSPPGSLRLGPWAATIAVVGTAPS